MRDPTQYVPSHVGIWTHRKFIRLTRRVATDERIVFACLHSLWQAANAQATGDGNLRGWDALDIAAASRWTGDAEAWLSALIAEGWLERRDDAIIIHDWEEYAGEWRVAREQRREKGKQRSQRWRERHDGSRDASPSVTEAPVTHRDDQRRDDQRREEREEHAASPPLAEPAPAPLDRSRQSPDAPAPRPGKVLSDDEIAALRMGRPPQRLGFGGVGFMENPATFPLDVDALIEQHGADLRKSFPMLDGRPPRPSLRDAVASKWGAYVANRARNGGHANAYSALKTWLGEMAQKHRVSWEREHATVVDNSAAVQSTRDMLKPLEGPHPAELIDPEEVRALLSGIGRKRGRSSGGTETSGEVRDG